MSQVNYNHQQIPTQPDVAVTVNIQLMIAAVIFLFMVVVFIFFLYIYLKHYMGSISRSRTRFIFATDQTPVPTDSRGLDTEILNSLPVTIYKRFNFKEGLECAVCLSVLNDGEKARLLPKCNHGFHLECIDMWFHSHSTCPLCRAPITKDVVEVGGHSNFPTNVLFWGDRDDRVSNGREGTSLSSLSLKRGGEGMLVIDIPRRGSMEDIASSLSVSKSPMDEVRTPSSSRLRSLRRLLSRGKMVIGSYSPRVGDDLERGVVGEGSSLTPKTPSS